MDLRGPRNSTRFLLTRWSALPLGKRLFFQGATIGANLIAANLVAAPIGLPNQIAGAPRVDAYPHERPARATLTAC